MSNPIGPDAASSGGAAATFSGTKTNAAPAASVSAGAPASQMGSQDSVRFRPADISAVNGPGQIYTMGWLRDQGHSVRSAADIVNVHNWDGLNG